jgi:hypothetical protein
MSAEVSGFIFASKGIRYVGLQYSGTARRYFPLSYKQQGDSLYVIEGIAISYLQEYRARQLMCRWETWIVKKLL